MLTANASRPPAAAATPAHAPAPAPSSAAPPVEVVAYGTERQGDWDAFVARAKNGHFLFHRGYMDYHADRFVDASLMAYQGGELVAVMPANRAGDQVVSHAGLTFGGLLMTRETRVAQAEAILRAMAAHWHGQGARSVLYKAMPWTYATYPAQEDLFALHRLGARLARRDYTSTVDLRDPAPPGTTRTRLCAKARKAGVVVLESDRLAEYHAVLEHTLQVRHEARPVHSLAELRLLRERFPQNIRLFEASLDGRLLSGVIVYETERVAHAQYFANGPEGRELGALDLVVEHLLGHYKGRRPFFDFGISTEDQGRTLNEGLAFWKEAWGGRGVVHDFYELPLPARPPPAPSRPSPSAAST